MKNDNFSARLAKVVLILLVSWIIYRPVTHFLCLPMAVHASWVDPLATTGTGYRHFQELHTGGHDVREFSNDIQPVLAANEQKRKLYAAFKTGIGQAGLLRRSSTVEGRPIFSWVLVQNGKVRYIRDCSHDDGARPWEIHRQPPLDFKLGFMREGEFIEGEPASTNSPVLVFQMKVHNVLHSQQIDEAYFF